MERVSVTFLGAIAVGYAFLGCGEAGNGVLKSESRDVPAFSRITNSSAVNVYITIGGSTAANRRELWVSGDQNLVNNVETYVENGRLYVEDDQHISFMEHELKVAVTIPSLSDVELTGSGDMEILRLDESGVVISVTGSGDLRAGGDFGHATVELTGSGDVYLSGAASFLDARVTGSGDLAARGLRCPNGQVRVSGSGDAAVCVTDALDATTSGSGDIDYYCDPSSVHEKSTGSGDINAH